MSILGSVATEREYHIEPIFQYGRALHVATRARELKKDGWGNPVVQPVEDNEGRIVNVLVMTRVKEEVGGDGPNTGG